MPEFDLIIAKEFSASGDLCRCMQQRRADSAVTRHRDTKQFQKTLWWLEIRSAFEALRVCVINFKRVSPVLFEIFQSGQNLFPEQ